VEETAYWLHIRYMFESQICVKTRKLF